MGNNAANSIDAKSKTLMDLLLKKKYQVKYFQREYKWQKFNIEDLLVDLERSFMSNFSLGHTRDDVPEYDCYYMGPIVLYREKTSHIIVDGQQRLTTFTLILIYLNHLQKEISKHNIINLDEYIYSQPYATASFNLEIPEREEVLSALFKGEEVLESSMENESSQNIYDRYYDIIDLFPANLKHESVLPLFINWIIEKLIFIEILAQTSDSAYTIFESMNDRGLKLTQSELLKSYLLSNVKDEVKIKELDVSWKKKMALFKMYSQDEEEHFFKAWLRAKYAVTIRLSERGASNMDFEKIGTRFSNWVQDSSKRLLGLDTSKPESFFFFVHSDFHFFSDLYLKLSDYETLDNLPEHTFRLISYKGVSSSLSYPFILSSITKLDDEETIENKINLSISFLDSFAIYRMLLNNPITQSSIDTKINNLIKEIRDNSIEKMTSKLQKEIDQYRKEFLQTTDYLHYDSHNSKYILSRMFKKNNKGIKFESIFFQRKKDSCVMYQFYKITEVSKEVYDIPKGLRDIFLNSLCSYCVVPRQFISEFEELNITKRIYLLIKRGYIAEFSNDADYKLTDLRSFFIERNKRMKERIYNDWKI
jgi:hypothetical protein